MNNVAMQTILAFWFDELEPADWFHRSDAHDETIRARFGETHARLLAAAPAKAADDPRETLALVILFDQFSRNMFRNDPRAFAADALALSIVRDALTREQDMALGEQERVFLYMPFMHSENLADQETSVRLFTDLGREDNVKYAILHRDVIATFGRFPHRNAVLGRETTAAEAQHLAEHGGF